MGSSERKAVGLHIKFEDGSPILLLVKRNEAKLIVLDVKLRFCVDVNFPREFTLGVDV